MTPPIQVGRKVTSLSLGTWFREEQTKAIFGPKLLIFDEHSSHLTYTRLKLATDNNIHCICLQGHTSHALQPLDVSVFKSVKCTWRKVVDRLIESNLSDIDFDIDYPLDRTKVKPNVMCANSNVQ